MGSKKIAGTFDNGAAQLYIRVEFLGVVATIFLPSPARQLFALFAGVSPKDLRAANTTGLHDKGKPSVKVGRKAMVIFHPERIARLPKDVVHPV